MSNNKVHSQGNIPFSWENKPGISKATPRDSPADTGDFTGRLPPPPPCRPETARASSFRHDLQIPLPPCAFQPPLRSSSRRGLRKQDDPFLMAYKECTKSSGKGDGLRKKKMSVFSCKHSCSVRDDTIIRISQLPISKSHREKEREM